MSAAVAMSVRLYVPASMQPAALELARVAECAPAGVVPVEGSRVEAARALVSAGVFEHVGGSEYRLIGAGR